jgi:hypothetical protein
MTTRVTCVRCHEERWTSLPEPYTCQRCRAVLAGQRNVVDPLPSEAQRASRARNLGSFAGKLPQARPGSPATSSAPRPTGPSE